MAAAEGAASTRRAMRHRARAACLDAAVGGGWGVAAAADEEGADGALTLTLDGRVVAAGVAAADAARDLLDMSAAACAALDATGQRHALARCMRGERLWALTREPPPAAAAAGEAARWRVDTVSEQIRPESMEV